VTSSASVAVERTLWIAARPEIVFALLTEATQVPRWLGLDAEIDSQPGGLYRVRTNDLGHTIRGRFIEVVPHTRVVYSWGWEVGDFPIPPESTTVEFTLTPVSGGTELHLLHRGLPSVAEVAESHGRGWEHYLARLSAVASGGEAGPDPWADGGMGESDG
jgi:uncharacterized protein YndB with AHSA1/START domain